MSSLAPLVSVVIACFDRSGYAYEALASTKSAYTGPLEVIILDGGDRKPGSRRRLEEAAERIRDERCRIEIAPQKNRNLAAGRNDGLARGSGEYVQLLDGEDVLSPGKLDEQVLHFQLADALDVSVTDCIFANESLDVFERKRNLLADFNYDLPGFAAQWNRDFPLPAACALFRREVFATHKFDEGPAAHEDWLFWTRLAAAGARIAYLGGPGAIRRSGAGGVRPSLDEGVRWLRSALEIDRIMRPILPNFFSEALEWHESRCGAAAMAAEQSVAADLSRTPEALSPPVAAAAPRVRSNSAPPRISVVVPVYEHFAYLERCLASVSAQLDDDIEVVVVDDGSRDPRIAPLLTRFAHDFDARMVSRSENRGVAATLNEALTAAAGEYVAFLDCDDALPPEALNKALAYLESDSDCDYLFTDRYDVSENGEILRLARYGGYRDDRFTGEFRRDLLNGMVASHLKVIRRTAIARAGGFAVATSGVQDWVMALEIAEFGRFGYLPEPLYNYRVHSDTVTRSDLRGQAVRTNRVRRRFAERYFRERRIGRFSDRAESATAPRILAASAISLRSLSEEWSAQPLIANASAETTAADIGKLREFNSYFDEILWSAPEIHAALLGYVWSPDILRRV